MNDIARELIEAQMRALDHHIQVALERRGAIKEDLSDVQADLDLARRRRAALKDVLDTSVTVSINDVQPTGANWRGFFDQILPRGRGV